MARDIGIGPRGQVWIIGAEKARGGGLIHRWTGKGWSKISGAGVRIAVDNRGNPWVVNSAGQIWQNQGGNKWKLLPGKASDIGVGANGKVWVAGTNAIYSWEGKGWRIGGLKASSIAVDRMGMPWMTSARGEIYRIVPGTTLSPKAQLAAQKAAHAKMMAAIKKRQMDEARKRAAMMAKIKRAQQARMAALNRAQNKPIVHTRPTTRKAVDPIIAMRTYNDALSGLTNTLAKVKDLKTAYQLRPKIRNQIASVNKNKAAVNFKDVSFGEKDKNRANQLKAESNKNRSIGSRYKKEATRVMKLRSVGEFLAPTMNQLKL
jgi:hypothetical protein